MIGRFVFGVVGYFLTERFSHWIWITICCGIVILGNIGALILWILGADNTFGLIAPCVLIGFGVGGIWTMIPFITLEDGGYKHFGQNWGTTLLFALLGLSVFTVIDEVDGENGIVSCAVFVVFNIGSLVCALIGLKHDKEKRSKKSPQKSATTAKNDAGKSNAGSPTKKQ